MSRLFVRLVSLTVRVCVCVISEQSESLLGRKQRVPVPAGAGSDVPRGGAASQTGGRPDVQSATIMLSSCPYFKITQVFLHRACQRLEKLQSAPVSRQSQTEERRMLGRL